MVTGGARGQGQAIAAKMAAEGADIVLCDAPGALKTVPYGLADKADLDESAAFIRASGRRCIAEAVDVRDQESLNALVARAVDELGGIDILCGNAGIVSFAPSWEMPEQMWQDVIDVNLTGTWKSVRAVAPHMIGKRSGSIILTTSVNAREPLANMTHYVAAKHGVLGLMRAFALELGPYGVRVNAVAPGVVATPASNNDAVRSSIFGRPDATFEDYLEVGHNWTALRNASALAPYDVANAMIWLASDEAQHVTGMELTVDSGHMILPGYNTNPIIDADRPPVDYRETALGTPPHTPQS